MKRAERTGSRTARGCTRCGGAPARSVPENTLGEALAWLATPRSPRSQASPLVCFESPTAPSRAPRSPPLDATGGDPGPGGLRLGGGPGPGPHHSGQGARRGGAGGPAPGGEAAVSRRAVGWGGWRRAGGGQRRAAGQLGRCVRRGKACWVESPRAAQARQGPLSRASSLSLLAPAATSWSEAPPAAPWRRTRAWRPRGARQRPQETGCLGRASLVSGW